MRSGPLNLISGPQAFPGMGSGPLNLTYGPQAFPGMDSGPLALISTNFFFNLCDHNTWQKQLSFREEN